MGGAKPTAGDACTFSDGVLAIIITIMVLEPKAPRDTSWHALLALWPA
jgi:uncharacterized membrane protein